MSFVQALKKLFCFCTRHNKEDEQLKENIKSLATKLSEDEKTKLNIILSNLSDFQTFLYETSCEIYSNTEEGASSNRELHSGDPNIVNLIFHLAKIGHHETSKTSHNESFIENNKNDDKNDLELEVISETNYDNSNSHVSHYTILNDVSTGNEAIQNNPELLTATNVKNFSYIDIKEKTFDFNKEKYEGFKSSGRLIGSGGFGKVYLAVDLFEDTHFVTVKVMKNKDEETYKYFFREIKIMAEVDHENILRLLGYSCDVRPCLIYEYAAGGDLTRRLGTARRAEDVYEFKDRIKNLWEISNALVYLHCDKGLVHRDVKPGNILFDGRVAKLCDFHLSKPQVRGHVTETRIAGTQNYMAPELTWNEVTTSADVYAFGLVMLETLTDLKLVDTKREIDKYLPDFVKKCIKDPGSHHEFMTTNVGMPHKSEARLKLIEFALTCARPDKTERPHIKFMYKKLLERL